MGLAWHQSTPSQTSQVAKNTDFSSSPLSSESPVRIPFPDEGFPVVVDEGHSVVIHWERQEHKVVLPIFLADLSLLLIHADGQAPKVVDQTPRRVLLPGARLARGVDYSAWDRPRATQGGRTRSAHTCQEG